MTPTATPSTCPKCQVPLVTDEHEAPWCERCEWNLGAYQPGVFIPWPWSAYARIDHKLGFRTDARLIKRLSAESSGSVRVDIGEWVLRLISAVLILALAALAGFGVWLIAANFFSFLATLGGLILIGIAYALRPRPGRLKQVLSGTFPLNESKQPALFALIRDVANASGTRMPDRVVVDFETNASAAVVGWRRCRVLTIGVPLWIALRRQERVAMLAHEFGHFANDDNLRSLLIQPATSTFGALASALRPRGDFDDAPAHALLLAWRLMAGTIAWLLWMVHVGLNVVGAKQGRRNELQADRLSAKVAGSAAAVSTTDVLASIEVFQPYFSASAHTGTAAVAWRNSIEFAREHIDERLNRLHQLSKRTQASLFGSHPAPGHRRTFLAQIPYQEPIVVNTEAQNERIDAEFAVYAEVMLKRLKEAEAEWNM